MADIEQITAHIYHEKQESGSALCAQHALNSLLQGNYFKPSDLFTIALDILQREHHERRLGQASTDVDDTGFFSIQVLENAMNVWGQSLIRWRSDSMQPYHDHPQNQRAFILNCDQHWFTLRKFGDSENVGPWFNLNSSLERPEWVGETYLGMLLQQSEADGYSAFVVVPIHPDLSLPRSDADDVASSLLPSVFGAQGSSSARSPRSSSPALFEDEDFEPQDEDFESQDKDFESQDEDFESQDEDFESQDEIFELQDEDFVELQAALHAYLDGQSVSFSMPRPRPHVGPVASSSRARARSSGAATGLPNPFPSPPSPIPPRIPPPSTHPTDQPMENPVFASMAHNQEMLERMRQEQEAALREHYLRPGSDVEDEEEEQLRIALQISEAMAREQGGDQTGGGSAAGTRERPENTQARGWTGERVHDGHVYDDDDEDADFQAALRASLETAPLGAHTPNTTVTLPRTSSTPPPAYNSWLTSSDAGLPPPAEDVSVAETRRRRLARFGA